MDKIINLSLILLVVFGVATTVFVLFAFPTFLEFVETYVASDGQINNPSRVVYSIYIGFFSLVLMLFIFKIALIRSTDRQWISDLSVHIKILYLSSIVIIVLGIFSDHVSFLFEEDGVIENLTALFAFGASVIFLFLGLKSKGGIQSIFFYALSALLFLFAMEEISWGQRIIGWETPEAFIEINEQDETNLHNVFNHYFGVLYLIFFMPVCLFFFSRKDVVEIADKFPSIKPLVPYIPSQEFYYAGFIFLFLFPFTIFFDKGGETLEPVFALLFFGYAYDLYIKYSKRQKALAT